MGYELRNFRIPINFRYHGESKDPTPCNPQTNKALIRSPLFESLQICQAASSLYAWYTYSNRAYTQPFTAAFRWSWKPTKWLGIWKSGWLRKEDITELSFGPSWCLVIFETGRRPTKWVVGGLSTSPWHKADGTWWYVLDSLRIPKGCQARYQNYVFPKSVIVKVWCFHMMVQDS